MKIEWTETARQDRRNIYDYLEERNPIAAIEIDDLIEEKTDLLVDNTDTQSATHIAGVVMTYSCTLDYLVL